MKIIACVKQVADLQHIRIRKETREPIMNNIPLTIGDIDKNALEEGVRLVENNGGKVIVVSAGSEDLEETIKEGLAMGADEAVLAIDPELDGAESTLSSEVLAKVVQEIGEFDLILLGEGSSDNYSGQVGTRMAEILGLPLITYVKSIKVEGNRIQAERNLDDCLEWVEVEMPAVVMVMSEINEVRIPAVTQILKAGRKPKQVYSLTDLGIDSSGMNQKVKTLKNLAPEQERKQIIFKEDAETATINLFNALQAEGLIGR